MDCQRAEGWRCFCHGLEIMSPVEMIAGSIVYFYRGFQWFRSFVLRGSCVWGGVGGSVPATTYVHHWSWERQPKRRFI